MPTTQKNYELGSIDLYDRAAHDFEDVVQAAASSDTPRNLRQLRPGQTLRVEPLHPSSSLRYLGVKPWAIVSYESVPRDPVSTSQLRGLAFGNKMLCWLQIITTPTADTYGTCLLLHFDNRSYLIGHLAEGTQRAMVQRKVGLNRASEIFLTGPINWRSAGGLLGIILTVADITTHQKEDLKQPAKQQKGGNGRRDPILPGLNIHGGKNLAHLLATSRRFVFRKGLPINPQEIRHDPRILNASSDPDWQDENIKMWYMPVESTEHISIKSPRKRSHDEISGSHEAASADEDHKIVCGIVKEMFDSNWKIDALIETKLHDVQLPAKLFVRDEKGHLQVYQGPLPGDNIEVPNITVLVRQPWPASMVTDLPRTEPSRQSICYIVKNHDRRGKFRADEALRLGVTKSDNSKLTRGQSVTAKDGTIVTPEMVLEPTVGGKGFAVIDLPDKSFIESLLGRSEWSNVEMMKGLNIVFWMLGPDVLDDPRLQEFMRKNHEIRHIVCSGDDAPNMVAFESVAAQSYKLHYLDADRFPLPIYNNEMSVNNKMIAVSEGYENGRTGKRVQFAPQYVHQDDQIVPFPNIERIAQEGTWILEEAFKLAEDARKRVTDPEFLAKVEKVESDIPNRDAEIITLGTGSALPAKYRNVSATLVRVPGYGNYLFDCGENTLGQIRRVFGSETPQILRDLKTIWISHLHADHHLGTAAVIKAWHEETSISDPSARLQIASHIHMLDWLREYADVEDLGFSRLVMTNIGKVWKQKSASRRICKSRVFNEEEVAAFGLAQIDACFVDHCRGALATVFTWPSGLKIAYSGDCRPSEGFVEIGQGATLLIHESTFDDELQGDAIAKKHSTMSEAITVGRRMGARRIMLTHFSQRYQKVPLWDENFDVDPDWSSLGGKEKAKKDEVILMAFDYMRVKLGDFRKAQAFLPAIQRLFDEDKDN